MKPILFLLSCLYAPLWGLPQACATGPGAGGITLAFDEPAPQLRLLGEARRTRGVHGRALDLNGAGYAEVALQRPLRSAGGTLMLWVQPTWPEGDADSHALISFGWEDGRGGYAVLSQGFYERTQGRRLTFVLNQNELLCFSERQLEPGRWHFLTLVWSGGRWGFCKLFVDGVKVAQRVGSFEADYVSETTLYLGTDRATANRKGREARARIGQVRILDRALTEGAVKTAYRRACADAGMDPGSPDPWVAEVLKAHGRARTGPPPVPAVEARILLDADILWARSQEDTEAVIREAVEGGFNVLTVPVWEGRGTRYPSRLAPADPRLAERLARGEDPLAFLIERAHASGLELHAWFHVALRQSDILRSYRGCGTPDRAFDLHLPAFRDFIVSLVLEVADRYPVDGVNLDHIRTMGFCTSDACARDYRERTGRSLQSDIALRRRSETARKRLGEWNGAVVTDVVRRVGRGVRLLRPGIPISVDAHPLDPDLLLQGQDSVRWANEGTVDRIYNMDYRTRPDFGLAVRVRDHLLQPRKLVMLFSTYEIEADGPAPRDPRRIGDYVELTRRLLPGSGIAFYHRKQMPAEQRRALRDGPFSRAATPPWSSAPTGNPKEEHRVP